MPEVASAFVSLMPSAKGFGSSLNSQVGGEIDSSGKSMGARFGKIFGLLASGGAALAVGNFLKGSIDEARESQKVGAITAQVIKTTGSAAGVTAKQVGDLAGAISNQTGIDDEAIQSGSNLLLTFKNIANQAGAGNDIFNQTTQIMTDMATAMGTEPKAAAIQLGKALNDPIKGISALSRVGITFTEQQKAQIETMVKSGHTLDAQKIILKELNSEFGGTAAASATMGEKMSTSFNNFKEQIGTALLPTIDSLETTITTKVIPAVSGFVTGIQDGTGAGGQFASVVKTIGSGVANTAGFLNEHRSIVVGVTGAYVAYKVATLGVATAHAVSLVSLKLHTVGTVENTIVTKAAAVASKVWAAGQWLLNAALTANPIGLVVVAIAALVAGLVLAYKKSETFRNVVDTAFHAIGAAGRWLWNSALQPVINFIVNGFALILTGIGKMLHALGHIPGFGWAETAADAMDAAARKARELADGINKIHDKTVTITYRQIGDFASAGGGGHTPVEARASGGPVSAGSPYLVGENGPELFMPRTGGVIIPKVPRLSTYASTNMLPGSAPYGVSDVVAELRAQTAELKVVIGDQPRKTAELMKKARL